MKDLFNMDSVTQYDKSVHAKNGRARVFKTLGASNHTEHDRGAFDYYATEPKATELLLKLEHFNNNILEPCCGEGHISEVLKRGGITSHHVTLSIADMASKLTFLIWPTQNGTEIL